MKIAVTGCHGDVGRRVVLAALKQGHSVMGVDSTPIEKVEVHLEHAAHSAFTFVQADLRNFDEALKVLEGCDAVVQLASLRDPTDYVAATHNTNVVITWNMLRAAAEHGIKRYAQASSVNVITLVFSVKPQFHYFPIDEDHPCLPDEPYGLSKVIAEMQADAIVRRYPFMQIASLRLSWSVHDRASATRDDPNRRKNDLWGYVQEDSAAEAFLLAVLDESPRWSGHERFFICSPYIAVREPPLQLKGRYWPEVPIKEGKEHILQAGFFDCSKAERLLGWVHKDVPEELD